MKFKEESVVGTGATFTSGYGEQYPTKYAFKRKIKESEESLLDTLKNAISKSDIKYTVEGEQETDTTAILNININKNNLISGDDALETIIIQNGKAYIKNFTQKPIELGSINNPTTITTNFKKYLTQSMNEDKLRTLVKQELTKELTERANLNEISYRAYKKDTDATPKQKIGNAMKLIKKKINEIKKLVDYNSRLKEEMGVGANDYWKSTQSQLHSIAEDLNQLSNKFRNLGN